MKQAFGLMIACLVPLAAGACVHGSAMDKIRAGMTPDQVSAIIGPPDGTSNTSGHQCAHYTVLKDFWSRVPWDMSDPYYVCYTDGRVDTFGRATIAKTSGL